MSETMLDTDLFELDDVAYNTMARDGTWCRLPYPDHPKGCPNYPHCIAKHDDIMNSKYTGYHWYAVVEEFDLLAYSKAMRAKHPDWSDRQCKNLLYWQGNVMKRLKAKAEHYMRQLSGDVLLSMPEAHGVQVYETMERVGVIIRKNPDMVRKVMIIGVNRNKPKSPISKWY